MKPAASILIFIWALVMFQPAFAYFGGKPAYGECSRPVPEKQGCAKQKSKTSCTKKKAAKTSCSKKKCGKPAEMPGSNDCRSGGCNPSLGCASGNFFIHHYEQVSLLSWEAPGQKMTVTDDNRIMKNRSECFHPPEA